MTYTNNAPMDVSKREEILDLIDNYIDIVDAVIEAESEDS